MSSKGKSGLFSNNGPKRCTCCCRRVGSSIIRSLETWQSDL